MLVFIFVLLLKAWVGWGGGPVLARNWTAWMHPKPLVSLGGICKAGGGYLWISFDLAFGTFKRSP